MSSFYDGTFDRECQQCGETVPADEDLWLHKDKDEINVGDCCKETLEAEGWINPNDDSLEGWVPDGSHILTKHKTVTEKLSEALSEAIRERVVIELDCLIGEHNDWFMELLDERLKAATKGMSNAS